MAFQWGARASVCVITGLLLGVIVKDEFNISALRRIHDCSLLNGLINGLGEEQEWISLINTEG